MFTFIIAFIIVFGIGLLIRSMMKKKNPTTQERSNTLTAPPQAGPSNAPASTAPAAFCANCGAKITSGAAFCSNCGTKVT